MKKPVVLRAKADQDIDAALEHCLAEAPGLAGALLAALEATVTAIGRAPALGSPRYAHALDLPGLRHRATKRFPYLVFYVEGPTELAILRVLHQSRDIPSGFDGD